MIKVLFFIEGLSGGGAEKVLRNLVNHMDQKKFDITVQTLTQEDAHSYLVPGIHYRAVNRCRTSLGRKLFSYWFRLCAELKLAYPLFVKGDYDIEAAYLETVSTKIIAQSTNQKAAKVAWVHCDLSRKEGMMDQREKLAGQYSRFDRIFCVSEGVEQGFQQVFGTDFPTEVLYNVIDEEEIYAKADADADTGMEEDCVNLVAVGRLSKQKNFPHLIETCARLRDDGARFRLSILGEGPERDHLERQIEQLGLSDCVALKGFCDNPYPYIKQADLLVCSSLYEGLSTVVLEALVLGRAVVTTPCTGMKELLGDSEYGLIAKDTPDGLYEALTSMLHTEKLRKWYQQQAQLRGGDFSREKALEVTEGLFSGLIEEHQVGGKE